MNAFLAVWFAGLISMQYPQQAPPQNGVEERSQYALPKPGHPLDSRDVDILTGKADRRDRAAYYPPVTPYVSPYLNGYDVRNRTGFEVFPGAGRTTLPFFRGFSSFGFGAVRPPILREFPFRPRVVPVRPGFPSFRGR